jgi:putative membrane protein
MRWILTWLIMSAAVWITSRSPHGLSNQGFAECIHRCGDLRVAELPIGLALFAVFTIATLGVAWLLAFITRWIINALLLMVTDKLTDHLKIDSFGWALGAAFLISVLSTIGQFLLRGLP